VKNVELSCSNSQTDGNRFNIVFILKTVCFSFIVSIFLLIIGALFLTYSNLHDEFIKVMVNLIVVISVMTCGFKISRKSKSQGWLNGSIGGFLYVSVLYLVGSLTQKNFNVSVSSVLTFALGLSCGMLGGMIGVNTKKRFKGKSVK
jgi:putative membrane protein (TIGR04086 family)